MSFNDLFIFEMSLHL